MTPEIGYHVGSTMVLGVGIKVEVWWWCRLGLYGEEYSQWFREILGGGGWSSLSNLY